MLLLVSSSTADPVVLAFQFRNLNLTILYFIHRYFCHFEQLQKHYWYRYRYIPIWVKKMANPKTIHWTVTGVDLNLVQWDLNKKKTKTAVLTNRGVEEPLLSGLDVLLLWLVVAAGEAVETAAAAALVQTPGVLKRGVASCPPLWRPGCQRHLAATHPGRI